MAAWAAQNTGLHNLLTNLYFNGAPPPETLTAPKPTVAGRIQNGLAHVMEKVGYTPRHAQSFAGKATGFANDVTPVGGVIEADKSKDAFENGSYGAGLGHGLLAIVNSFPEAGPIAGKGLGAVMHAMFAGIAAKTADKVALAQAEHMLSKGASREDIWNNTGWFKGVDDKWRYEIPDNNMTMNPVGDPWKAGDGPANAFAAQHGAPHFTYLNLGSPERNEANRLMSEGVAAARKGKPISDVIQHPQLQASYKLPDITVAPMTADPFEHGSWTPDENLLRINYEIPAADQRSIAAHELQHFVQGKEGFAVGGMPENFEALPKDDANDALVLRSFVDRAGGADNFPAGLGAFLKAMGREPSSLAQSAARQYELPELQAFVDPFNAYRRTAGEVEARNVQTRLNFSPEQRRATPPWQTEDVAPQDQIVRFR